MFRSLLLLLALCLPITAFATHALDEAEVEFIRLINEYRAEHGLGCLAPSPTLNVAADYLSRAMGEQDFFSHEEPPCDSTGKTCTGRSAAQRMVDLGHVGARAMGENIAGGMSDAATAFIGWKNSPPHDANMLEPAFKAIGIGRVMVPGSELTWYWTTDFSNLVDGTWDCTPPFKPIDPPGAADEESGDRGGCGAAEGGLSALGLLLVLRMVGKRRALLRSAAR